MERPDDHRREGPGKAEERRRLFEQSRGLHEKRALPLDDDDTAGEAPPPAPGAAGNVPGEPEEEGRP